MLTPDAAASPLFSAGRFWRWSLTVLLLAGCCGCSTLRMRHAAPPEKQARLELPGLPGVRAWGDEANTNFVISVARAFAEEREFRRQQGLPPCVDSFEVLAISGGAANGAYGAGLLCGWTQAGDRPKFKIVTGISTGALIAPLAFLGPAYDGQLSEFYTNINSKQIYQLGFLDLFRLFSRDFVADTKPLRRLVERCYTAAMLDQIAEEHRRGRRLYVGTASLDAQRPVVWDMGAIAASQHPRKLEWFHDLLLASAAIPVAFRPVYLDVTADGQSYDEMHVDGGLFSQVFVSQAVWDALEMERRTSPEFAPKARVFVVRNNHNSPDWQAVKPRVVPIAKRSLATLTKSNSNGDLFRIYTLARQYGADFNLAFIPADVNLERQEEFDKRAMRQMYLRGFAEAAAGYPWRKQFDPANLPATEASAAPRRP